MLSWKQRFRDLRLHDRRRYHMVANSALTRLIAQDDFSTFIRNESFSSYKTQQGFPSDIIPAQLPADILYKFPICPMHDMFFPISFNFNLATIIILVKRPNYEILQYENFQDHITSSPLSQNIFLSTLVSNTLNFDFPLEGETRFIPKRNQLELHCFCLHWRYSHFVCCADGYNHRMQTIKFELRFCFIPIAFIYCPWTNGIFGTKASFLVIPILYPTASTGARGSLVGWGTML
jgi:hypothetical protein